MIHNSEDPDQIASVGKSSLIWVCTVYSDTQDHQGIFCNKVLVTHSDIKC